MNRGIPLCGAIYPFMNREPYYKFYRAVENEDLEEVVRIIEHHPELHAFSGVWGSFLDILAWNAPQLLEPAFRAGLSPDSATVTPFVQHCAANGLVRELKLAIQYGANLEVRNEEGETALGFACGWDQFEAVKILVEAGADINALEGPYDDEHWCSPLDTANGKPEIFEYLKSRGAKTTDEILGDDNERILE